MMSYKNEDEFRDALQGAMEAHGFGVQRHEDKLYNFIPDLSFGVARHYDGWIEVKWKNEMPPKLDAIDHWTRGQERWLESRGAKGSGNCFLVVGTPGVICLWGWDRLSAIRRVPYRDAIMESPVRAPTVGAFVPLLRAYVVRPTR